MLVGFQDGRSFSMAKPPVYVFASLRFVGSMLSTTVSSSQEMVFVKKCAALGGCTVFESSSRGDAKASQDLRLVWMKFKFLEHVTMVGS
jgi:hypothetical protein